MRPAVLALVLVLATAGIAFALVRSEGSGTGAVNVGQSGPEPTATPEAAATESGEREKPRQSQLPKISAPIISMRVSWAGATVAKRARKIVAIRMDRTVGTTAARKAGSAQAKCQDSVRSVACRAWLELSRVRPRNST